MQFSFYWNQLFISNIVNKAVWRVEVDLQLPSSGMFPHFVYDSLRGLTEEPGNNSLDEI